MTQIELEMKRSIVANLIQLSFSQSRETYILNNGEIDKEDEMPVDRRVREDKETEAKLKEKEKAEAGLGKKIKHLKSERQLILKVEVIERKPISFLQKRLQKRGDFKNREMLLKNTPLKIKQAVLQKLISSMICY